MIVKVKRGRSRTRESRDSFQHFLSRVALLSSESPRRFRNVSKDEISCLGNRIEKNENIKNSDSSERLFFKFSECT